jgi:hypothetical protein
MGMIEFIYETVSSYFFFFVETNKLPQYFLNAAHKGYLPEYQCRMIN